MKTYIIQDAEAGNFIDSFSTLDEAEKTLAEFEEEDRENGTYEEGFYEIVEADEE